MQMLHAAFHFCCRMLRRGLTSTQPHDISVSTMPRCCAHSSSLSDTDLLPPFLPLPPKNLLPLRRCPFDLRPPAASFLFFPNRPFLLSSPKPPFRRPPPFLSKSSSSSSSPSSSPLSLKEPSLCPWRPRRVVLVFLLFDSDLARRASPPLPPTALRPLRRRFPPSELDEAKLLSSAEPSSLLPSSSESLLSDSSTRCARPALKFYGVRTQISRRKKH
jgi:hypothetical protein